MSDPTLVAEFDSEWETVLELAKQSKDLPGVHDLLSKWWHTAYLEMREPGSHYRMLAKAEQIMRAGAPTCTTSTTASPPASPAARKLVEPRHPRQPVTR